LELKLIPVVTWPTNWLLQDFSTINWWLAALPVSLISSGTMTMALFAASTVEGAARKLRRTSVATNPRRKIFSSWEGSGLGGLADCIRTTPESAACRNQRARKDGSAVRADALPGPVRDCEK